MNGSVGEMIGPADLGPLMPALLDALSAAGIAVIVIIDRGNGLERYFTNKNAAVMFGYTPAEVNQIPVLDMIAPAHRGVVMQLAQMFRDGQPVPPVLEFSAVHRDGSLLTIEFAMGFSRLPDALAYTMTLRDVNAAQQAQLSLLEADRIGLVGALAAGFAHEINNPLTSVLLNLRSLRKQMTAFPEVAQAQMVRCLEDITTGAERIASNVRALQTLATRSALQSVDLASVVTSALRLAAPTLEPRAHVTKSISPVAAVTGEESRIGQAVLAMLLFSASGFDVEVTSPRNRIEIVVEQRGSEVMVEVSDNGRDLTSDEVRSAFDPFFRSSARGAGVGVGLGVARSVAATLGGVVTLVPHDGGGACITMLLPVATS